MLVGVTRKIAEMNAVRIAPRPAWEISIAIHCLAMTGDCSSPLVCPEQSSVILFPSLFISSFQRSFFLSSY